MDDDRLVDQVIVHADAAEEAGHRVAQQLSQGQQRERRAQHQSGEAERVNRAVDHLPALDFDVVPGGGLEAQHPQQGEENEQENDGGKRLRQQPLFFISGGFRPLRAFAHADERHGGQHPDRVDVEEVQQLVHDHGVVRQSPQAPGPETEAGKEQQAQRRNRFFHHAAGDQREQQVGLHLDGQGPAGGPEGRRDVGIVKEGEGKGQVGRHVLDHIRRAAVQVPGKGDADKNGQRDEIVAGQDPFHPAEIEIARVRRRGAVAHRLRVGQEEQEGTQQHGSVHPDISGADQVVQAVASQRRMQPALLPDMVPADDEDHQHPQAVQLRDPLSFLTHGRRPR